MRPDSSTNAVVLTEAHGALLDYWELTKPRVVWLILMSTAVGFYMATSGSISWSTPLKNPATAKGSPEADSTTRLAPYWIR